ncbi:MAG: hypothetical protein ABEI07_00405, partial [Candidatus Nanohaloarchaea archaeon]
MKERKEAGVRELEQSSGIPNVMRPAQWLEEEGLVEIEEEKTVSYALTSEGERVLEEGLPEEKVLEKVEGGETSIEDVQGLGEVAELGIGKAKEKGLIEIEGEVLHLTEEGEDVLDEEHEELEALRRIREGEDVDDSVAETLLDRGLIQEEETVHRRLILTERGQELDLSEVEEEFNVEVPAEDALVGRKHFAREVYDYIRRVWVEMGFQEMNGPLVVPSLLNF